MTEQVDELITKLIDERKITAKEAFLLIKATQPEVQIVEKPIYYPIYNWGYYWPSTTHAYDTKTIGNATYKE